MLVEDVWDENTGEMIPLDQTVMVEYRLRMLLPRAEQPTAALTMEDWFERDLQRSLGLDVRMRGISLEACECAAERHVITKDEAERGECSWCEGEWEQQHEARER